MLQPTDLLLQTCSGKPGYEHLTDFEFIKSITCTYGNELGVAVFLMIVYGGIVMSIYTVTDDVRIPAVLTLITGGAALPQVASPALTFATLVLLFSGAGVITLLYYRYSR
jgi:hypothetical protein